VPRAPALPLPHLPLHHLLVLTFAVHARTFDYAHAPLTATPPGCPPTLPRLCCCDDEYLHYSPCATLMYVVLDLTMMSFYCLMMMCVHFIIPRSSLRCVALLPVHFVGVQSLPHHVPHCPAYSRGISHLPAFSLLPASLATHGSGWLRSATARFPLPFRLWVCHPHHGRRRRLVWFGLHRTLHATLRGIPFTCCVYCTTPHTRVPARGHLTISHGSRACRAFPFTCRLPPPQF